VNVTPTGLAGVLVLEPTVLDDARGRFFEAWRLDRYAAAGLPEWFVQDNVSVSRAGVLRGLHVQHPDAQGKLISVLRGEVFDVAVDVRRGSPSFGRWAAARLSGDSGRQLYIPPGFAHGFVVTSPDEALVCYKCTAYYSRDHDLAIAWNDPAIAIDWPVAYPMLSPKDDGAPRLADVDPERLPVFAG
jgi:dTDP-4-dehydrorhamnose 3,5-epimerase